MFGMPSRFPACKTNKLSRNCKNVSGSGSQVIRGSSQKYHIGMVLIEIPYLRILNPTDRQSQRIVRYKTQHSVMSRRFPKRESKSLIRDSLWEPRVHSFALFHLQIQRAIGGQVSQPEGGGWEGCCGQSPIRYEGPRSAVVPLSAPALRPDDPSIIITRMGRERWRVVDEGWFMDRQSSTKCHKIKRCKMEPDQALTPHTGCWVASALPPARPRGQARRRQRGSVVASAHHEEGPSSDPPVLCPGESQLFAGRHYKV